jgi:uncharacterized protein (DUF1499 family)
MAKVVALLRLLPVALAVTATILLLTSGPGTRLELWSLRTGFLLLRWAAYVGLGAAICALVAWCVPKSRAAGLVGLLLPFLLGGGVAAVPWLWLQQAQSVPPIHDISTDTDHPPLFVAMLSRRADAPNPAAYGGPEVASQQRSAYPEIQPLTLAVPMEAAFARANEAVEGLGWDIVAADPATGRIEATDTTFWFGFKDDIVVRVAAAGSGSRIDVRSVSRVGTSDVGTNARRIKTYLASIAGAPSN